MLVAAKMKITIKIKAVYLILGFCLKKENITSNIIKARAVPTTVLVLISVTVLLAIAKKAVPI
jgi:hypothetical protein